MLTLEVAQALSRFDERMKQSVVEIRLADVSKKAFAKFTGDHIGEKTEFRFQGKVLVNSVIREPIVGGTVQISGYFTAEEALAIVSGLSAGSMIEIATVPH